MIFRRKKKRLSNTDISELGFIIEEIQKVNWYNKEFDDPHLDKLIIRFFRIIEKDKEFIIKSRELQIIFQKRLLNDLKKADFVMKMIDILTDINKKRIKNPTTNK
jgi:hypothetical protein